jgi:hypothetical protein
MFKSLSKDLPLKIVKFDVPTSSSQESLVIATRFCDPTSNLQLIL